MNRKNHFGVLALIAIAILWPTSWLSAQEEAITRTLTTAAESSNTLIQYHAYLTFSQQPKLVKGLGEDEQNSLIERALKSDNRSLSNIGFELIDNSKLDKLAIRRILVSSVSSDDTNVQDQAFARLD